MVPAGGRRAAEHGRPARPREGAQLLHGAGPLPGALVLCSPAAGGPSYLERVSRDWLAGEVRPTLLQRARELRSLGRGHDLLLTPRWWWVISANSALELNANVPDLVETAARVPCPTLAIRGGLESADAYPIERVRDASAIVDGGDHYYTGREAEAGQLVAEWLAKTL